jgi:hypothetical protein
MLPPQALSVQEVELLKIHLAPAKETPAEPSKTPTKKKKG